MQDGRSTGALEEGMATGTDKLGVMRVGPHLALGVLMVASRLVTGSTMLHFT